MKKLAKIFAVMAIVGFMFACDNNGNDNGNGEDQLLTGTLKIQVNGADVTSAITGTELTAVYTGPETGTKSFQWRLGETNAPGTSTNAAYTPFTAGVYTVVLTIPGFEPKISAPVTVSDLTLTIDVQGATGNNISVRGQYTLSAEIKFANEQLSSANINQNVTWEITATTPAVRNATTAQLTSYLITGNTLSFDGAVFFSDITLSAASDSYTGVSTQIILTVDPASWQTSGQWPVRRFHAVSGDGFITGGIENSDRWFLGVAPDGKPAYVFYHIKNPDWTRVEFFSDVDGGTFTFNRGAFNNLLVDMAVGQSDVVGAPDGDNHVRESFVRVYSAANVNEQYNMYGETNDILRDAPAFRTLNIDFNRTGYIFTGTDVNRVFLFFKPRANQDAREQRGNIYYRNFRFE